MAKADTPPSRIVSLNLCTDQLLLTLAPRERIAGLSFLAADPSLSALAAEAAGLPLLRGQAEEVLPLRPDLVLAGQYTARPTVALLRAHGIKVVEVGLTADFTAIRQQIRSVAAALGTVERGEAVIAAMDSTLDQARPPPGQARLRVLALAPGAFTAGSGTLSDSAMQAAGMENYAATKGLAGYGYLPLESIAADPPDLLLMDRDEGQAPSLNGQLLNHPALTHAVPVTRRPTVPARLWTCGGPFTAEAVRRLAAARDLLATERRP
ncbi:ABC transporter substrate-binding protein [Niveispirillum sp. SYP-B3756]|uniref:ABC transporter substrate-binding protein n=1 Tax=Niveispirillum sp. SYP-B3756 TaxID=2662178 RepID=UPI001563100E|nr:ABC transporter substrate-binding protein [Niveispirillum sp. SYP-B3756]